MRGCLSVLIIAAAFLVGVVWFGGVPLAETVVEASLTASAFEADELDVTVGADPPLQLALGRADRVEIEATGVRWEDLRAGSMSMRLDGVDLLARTATTADGEFRDVERGGRRRDIRPWPGSRSRAGRRCAHDDRHRWPDGDPEASPRSRIVRHASRDSAALVAPNQVPGHPRRKAAGGNADRGGRWRPSSFRPALEQVRLSSPTRRFQLRLTAVSVVNGRAGADRNAGRVRSPCAERPSDQGARPRTTRCYPSNMAQPRTHPASDAAKAPRPARVKRPSRPGPADTARHPPRRSKIPISSPSGSS